MYRIIQIILIATALLSCSIKKSGHGYPGQLSGSSIELLLDSAFVADYDLLAEIPVKQFYKQNHFKPVWFVGDSLRPAADSMWHFIKRSAFYGLNPNDYHFALISSLVDQDHNEISASTMDILFTDVFFAACFHLKNGRLSANSLTHISKITVDSTLFGELRRSVKTNEVSYALARQEPQHPDYIFLKGKLSDRLMSLDSLDRNTAHRYETLATDIKHISINMERWRWQRLPLPHRFVKVNIPQFELEVVEGDSVALRSSVVVGSKKNPTPVLESLIECMTIYPYWHVPRKISVNELLPAIQADTSYLRRNNFDVLDRKGNIVAASSIRWNRLNENYFPYILRQRDGDENSLGIIKFHFDNPYAVYLHDTNAKRYYKIDNRALSHGCVRVEQAIALAHYLVKDDSVNCTNNNLDEYLRLRQRKELDLTHPIPVRITYFTYAIRNKELILLHDVYETDKIMLQALYPEHEGI